MTGAAPADGPLHSDAPNLGDVASMGDVAAPNPVTGIVLAAGAGTRMGLPKALMRTADGTPWLQRAGALLVEAGCDPVLVVLGARADEARTLLHSTREPASQPTLIPSQPPLIPSQPAVRVVDAADWADGMAHSLRAGLAAASASVSTSPESIAVMITLVDMPDLPLGVVRRILDRPVTATSLRQAVYKGQPGHPVLVGRSHWPALIATLTGDRGARAYLAAHGVEEVECSDLFDGHDIDTLAEAAAPAAASASAVTPPAAAPLG